jgi:hypothetical protein
MQSLITKKEKSLARKYTVCEKKLQRGSAICQHHLEKVKQEKKRKRRMIIRLLLDKKDLYLGQMNLLILIKVFNEMLQRFLSQMSLITNKSF